MKAGDLAHLIPADSCSAAVTAKARYSGEVYSETLWNWSEQPKSWGAEPCVFGEDAQVVRRIRRLQFLNFEFFAPLRAFFNPAS
jgi:hypothetical protein